MTRSLPETLTEAARAAKERGDYERDREAWNLPGARLSGTTGRADPTRLMGGRFEARFVDGGSARTAARDARAAGFVVEMEEDRTGWLTIGRRALPFPADERDRYASRFRSIALQQGGTFIQFVEEPQRRDADGE